MIPAEQAHLIIVAGTHPGMRGKPNEDRYSISAYTVSPEDPTPSTLALLCDGIGGHHAGEVAAELAVKSVRQFIGGNTPAQPVQVMRQALAYANQVILNQGKNDPALSGMGTTCVCAWVIGDQLYSASVGDSRLYLQRGDKLTRLTTDHTWIQEALSQGTLTPEEVRGHPNAHIIRRFLGSMNPLTPDVRLRLSPSETDEQAEANQGMRLQPGDRLILCTDGLTDLVKDPELCDILNTSSLELGLTQLINLANQRGGHDNITVLIMEIPKPAYVSNKKRKILTAGQPKAPRTAATRWMIALLLLAIFMMLLLLIYTYFH
jgi:protein phosphatase